MLHRNVFSRRTQIALAWLALALWMGLIFAMSAMPGDISGEQSGTVVRILLAVRNLFLPNAPLGAQTLARMEWVVRKGAHMTEYAVLALLARRAFHLSGARHPALYALALSVAYAASDEYHQRFVGGRGPSPVDVMIDATGATLALIARRLLARLKPAKPASNRREA